MRGLVRGLPDLALRFVEHLLLTALQALPAERAFALAGLGLLDIRQRLVAPLQNGFHPTPTDQKDLHAIRGGKQGVHPQVHAARGLLYRRQASTLAQTRRTTPNDSRTAIKRPGRVMVAGTRMLSVPLAPWGRPIARPRRAHPEWCSGVHEW